MSTVTIDAPWVFGEVVAKNTKYQIPGIPGTHLPETYEITDHNTPALAPVARPLALADFDAPPLFSRRDKTDMVREGE